MNYLEWGPPKYPPAGPEHRRHSELYYITLKCVLFMWQARPNSVCQLKATASKPNRSRVLTEIQMMIIIMMPRHAGASGSAAAHLSAAPGQTSATFQRRFHRLLPLFLPPPSADHPAGGHPGGCHSVHRQARDGPRPAAEGGAGIRHPGAQHPVPEDGRQLAQGPGAAAEAGRAGGEWHQWTKTAARGRVEAKGARA